MDVAPNFEHSRRIIAELEARGAKEVRFLFKGRKHPCITFTYHGRKHKYFTSLSPSDYRATAKALADIRRILKEDK